MGRLSGVEVLETEDLGPAVIGFVRPRIAVPGWVQRLDARLQELVVRHEREHQLAGDPRLLAAGLVARALLPWCLPLWWQFRRLRLAIELDCDRRVLAAGASIADYGELLLEVGRRSVARPLPAVGIFERRSHLERRLRELAPGRPAHRLGMALALGLASAAVVVVGAAIPAPDPPVRWAAEREAGPAAPDDRPHVVSVGPEHRGVSTIEELERLDPADPIADMRNREGSIDIVPDPTRVRPTPVDTPPGEAVPPREPDRGERVVTPRDGFTFTPYTVKPRCVEGCDIHQLAEVFARHVPADARCTVTMGLRIDTAGRVTATDPLMPDRDTPTCTAAAGEWARTTRWTPALNRDRPVTVWIAQPMQYIADEAREQPPAEPRRDGLTDPDEIARAELWSAMVAQEAYRADHERYADASRLDLQLPPTVTIEVRGGGPGYVMVARHDDGTTAFCASSAEGRVVEGTDC